MESVTQDVLGAAWGLKGWSQATPWNGRCPAHGFIWRGLVWYAMGNHASIDSELACHLQLWAVMEPSMCVGCQRELPWPTEAVLSLALECPCKAAGTAKVSCGLTLRAYLGTGGAAVGWSLAVLGCLHVMHASMPLRH